MANNHKRIKGWIVLRVANELWFFWDAMTNHKLAPIQFSIMFQSMLATTAKICVLLFFGFFVSLGLTLLPCALRVPRHLLWTMNSVSFEIVLEVVIHRCRHGQSSKDEEIYCPHEWMRKGTLRFNFRWIHWTLNLNANRLRISNFVVCMTLSSDDQPKLILFLEGCLFFVVTPSACNSISWIGISMRSTGSICRLQNTDKIRARRKDDLSLDKCTDTCWFVWLLKSYCIL